MIQEEAFRCKSITEKLLDFSRCNDIKRERTDLAGLIQGVVDMIRHIGKYRGKTIVFQPRRGDPGPCGRPGDQAGRPEPGRSTRWTRWSSGGTLRIEARHNQGMAEMVFTDDGCGMAADVLENIFEPFFTRRATARGRGWGCRSRTGSSASITARSPRPAQAKGRARRSGSACRSTRRRSATDPGGRETGARASLARPRRLTASHENDTRRFADGPHGPSRSPDARTSLEGIREEVMIEKSRRGGLRILFADDEAHLRDLMQMELPRLGHEVTVCPDGTAASRPLENAGRSTPPCSTSRCRASPASRSWSRSASSAPTPRSSS